MASFRLSTRRAFFSQVLRCAVLALMLPPLVIVPGQAGIVLFHRHSDEAAHFHRFENSARNEWQVRHSGGHPCEEPEDHYAGDPAVATANTDRDAGHFAFTLVRDQLTARVRSSDSGKTVIEQATAVGDTLSATVTAADLIPARSPPSKQRADLATLETIASLLLRNHALLL